MPTPIPAPRQAGYTHTTPTPLYWAAYGPTGAPRLLVLHGGPGAHHDYLLPQMLALADRYELVFYDQRGGGRSKTDAREPITWRTQVEDMALVVRELALEPLSVIGYSWGGLLALLYAASVAGATELALPHAPAPGRLVLIDPAPPTRALRTRFETELARRQNGEAIQRMRAELQASGVKDRDIDAYRQRMFELSVAGYFAHSERARDLTPFRVTGRVQQSVWESLGDFDLLPALRTVTAPTLVVHGRQDPIPLESSEAIAAALPHAELVPLEESGHVPYVEAARELFAAVRDFLARTDSATA